MGDSEVVNQRGGAARADSVFYTVELKTDGAIVAVGVDLGHIVVVVGKGNLGEQQQANSQYTQWQADPAEARVQ